MLRRQTLVLGSQLAESAAVFVREHFDEPAAVLGPALEDMLRARAAGVARMPLEQALDVRLVGEALVPQLAPELRFLLLLGGERLERHHRGVAAFRERAVLVEDVGDAAGHAGGKISSAQA